MVQKKYALHELLEVHEILTLKTANLAKAHLFKESAVNDELKQLLDEDIETSEKTIKELKQFIQTS